MKASITGSILGNLLLILGLALVAGGANRSELKFNRTSAGMSAGMLALAVVALVFPALFHSVHPEAAARVSELRMSEAVAGDPHRHLRLLAALHPANAPHPLRRRGPPAGRARSGVRGRRC